MARWIALTFLLALACSVNAQPAAVRPTEQNSDSRPEVVLLSWWEREPEGFYVFLSPQRYEAIVHHVSVDRNPPGRDQFQKLGLHKGLAQLRRAITQLPEGSVVYWRGYKMSDTSYPQAEVVDQIKVFAAAHSIEVRVNPYERDE
jgi:hypothetical protein